MNDSAPTRSRPATAEVRPIPTTSKPVPMTGAEREQFYKQRRSRSVGLAVALAAVVIIFYIISLIQGPAILNRPM